MTRSTRSAKKLSFAVPLLALSAAVLLPLAAHAQTSTLEPFTLSGQIQIGQAAPKVLRPLTWQYFSFYSWTGMSSLYAYPTVTLNELQTPLENDGSYRGQLARDNQGTLLQWRSSQSTFFYQANTRQFTLFMDSFTSPATGDKVLDYIHADLCSVVVRLRSLTPGDKLATINLTATDNGLFSARFDGTPVSGSLPEAADGFVVASDPEGREIAQAEFLVTPNTANINLDIKASYGPGSNVTVPLKTISTDAQTCAQQFVDADIQKPPPASIEGSLWLENSTASANAPAVTSYGFWAYAPYPYYFGFSFPVTTQAAATNYVAGPLASYAYSVGGNTYYAQATNRYGYGDTFYLPAGTDTGFWAPVVSMTPTPVAPQNGVYADGTILVDQAETEHATFHAPMSFIEGTIGVSSCLAPLYVTSGKALDQNYLAKSRGCKT